MTSLAGLTALVTGANSGIGRGIALSLAHHGANVVVTGLNTSPRAGGYEAEPAVDTDALIRERGGQAIFVRTDVTVAGDVEAAVAAAVAAFGRLDVMVNNAGAFTGLATIIDQSEEDYDLTMAVNAKGTFMGCKYAIRQMMAQAPREGGQRGSIVNIASVGSVSGLHLEPAYCASKGAVLALTRQLATDFGPQHIRSNAILPGVVQTAMSRVPLSDEGTVGFLRQFNTFPRFGDAGDIGEAAAFLASDAAGYVNGAALAVDGGFTAL
jgi:Dehydrogenases with different specificities (related to short-chain alcohol dehydrogenases)